MSSVASARDGAEDALVDIHGIAAGGAGVGRLPDGRAVFVQRTAPGERVHVQVTHRRKRWARAQLLDVVEASPARRTPPCVYYARCGGCTLEHLDYDAQLQSKRSIVVQALRRIGGVRVEEDIVAIGSPREFRYRNRVSFALRRGSDGGVVAGFHELERPEQVLDLDGACLLPEEPIARAWDALRAGWGNAAVRLPGGSSLRLTLRATQHGEVTLLIEGGTGRGDPEALLEEVPLLRAIWHAAETGAEPELIAGAETVDEQWGDRQLPIGRRAFVQVNRDAARLLETHVLERAGRLERLRVVDAYCGIGSYARALAARGADTVGIEMDADAVAAARVDAPGGAEFIVGDVGREIPALLPAELVIVNPPRGGLGADVSAALTKSPPRRLIYVSCDPATLARDVSRLGDAFTVVDVRCFDLFPQTAHVETVVELACAIT